MPADIQYPPGDVTIAGGASEATLQQVRDHLDTVETLLAAIRDQPDPNPDAATDTKLEQIRAILDAQALPTETQFVSPTPVYKTLLQRVFRAGGEVTTSAVSPNASLHIANPSASGKMIYVIGFAVYSDATAGITFHSGATSTGTLVTAQNMYQGSANPSSAEVRMGSNVISGGTQWSARSRVAMNAPVIRDVFVPLPPGTSLAVRFVGPGATNLVTFNGTWYEDPI